MTQIPVSTEEAGDPVVRVLGGYLASVAAAVTTFTLFDVPARMLSSPAPLPSETTITLPDDWITVAVTFAMALFLAGLFALPAFLVCLTVSVRAGLRHPAFHMACGTAIGLGLWRLFVDIVDRPVTSAIAGAVGGAVYWWLAVRNAPDRP